MKQEDIEFLKGLKKAIKEGDRCEQREPAFWMIMEKDYAWSSDPDGADEAVIIDGGEEWEDWMIGDLKDVLSRDVERGLLDGERLRWCRTVKDVIWLMEDEGLTKSVSGYATIRYGHAYWRLSLDTGAFLTREDALKHLKQNRYNYAEGAYPYALTAYRNPTFERLWRIITETDWEKEKADD